MSRVPALEWDEIDRAIGIMEQNGLKDVRGQGHGPNTATIDFNHPTPHPILEQRDIASSVEVGPGNQPPVLDYTIRFPQVVRGPNAPAKDEINLAATTAAEPFPEGRRVDVVLRQRRLGPDGYAPHIRGDQRPGISLFQFARMASQAQDAFYDDLL